MPTSERASYYAYINSRFESGMKSPLDDAILAGHPFDMTGWRKIDEVPFDFERRRVSVLVEQDSKRRLIVKGAPEDLLRLSGRYEGADGEEESSCAWHHGMRAAATPDCMQIVAGHLTEEAVNALAAGSPRA